MNIKRNICVDVVLTVLLISGCVSSPKPENFEINSNL